MTEATTKPVKLERWHISLLHALSETDGYTAAVLGKQVWSGMTPRGAASTANPHLKSLEGWGLVKRFDNERPIVWLRTPAGTAELADRAHSAVTAT